MEILKLHLEIAADLRGQGLPLGEIYHSVDIDKTCQRVLLGHNPLHVFKDLLALLNFGPRIAVQRVMCEYEHHVKALLTKSAGTSSTDDKKDAKAQLKTLGENLLTALMTAMNSYEDLFKQTVECCKHADSGGCLLFPENSNDKEYIMAGTSCTDWSSMGTQTSLAGSTVLPFAIELQIIKRRRPRVFFHECTRNFRPEILRQHLEGVLVPKAESTCSFHGFRQNYNYNG